MLLLPETEGLPELPNNLRISFLVKNQQGDVLHTVVDATNWRNLLLFVDDRSRFFKYNMVAIMVLNDDQTTALDETKQAPLPRLFLKNGLSIAQEKIQIAFDSNFDVFNPQVNGYNTLFDNPQYRAWRRVVATQLAQSRFD